MVLTMKKKMIALAGAVLLTGVLVMTGLILNGQTDASPFDYRSDININEIF